MSDSADSNASATQSPDPTTAAPAEDTLLAQSPPTPDTDAPADGATKTDSNGDDAAAQTPEKYTVVMPDGVTLDEKLLEVATPVLKELGLSNEAAQKLAVMKADYDKALAKEAEDRAVEQRKEWVAELKKDPQFDTLVKHAQRTVALVGGEAGAALVQRLNETGLGDDPVFVRAFAAIGARFGEKGFIPNAGVHDSFRDKRAADVLFPEFAQK